MKTATNTRLSSGELLLADMLGRACFFDMARFMIAHLQNGRYGDPRILSEATAQTMHSRLFAHDPPVERHALRIH